jgi:hypothetical protein
VTLKGINSGGLGESNSTGVGVRNEIGTIFLYGGNGEGEGVEGGTKWWSNGVLE